MKTVLIVLLSLLLLSCKGTKREAVDLDGQAVVHADSIYYARGFRIESHVGFKLVAIENPWRRDRGMQRYILVDKDSDLPAGLPEGIVVRTPLTRTVAFSSTVCGFLNELGALPALVGVAESEYIALPAVRAGIAAGTLIDIGQAVQPNIERLMLLDPEAIITNPVNEAGAGPLEKLTAPAIPCLEWMENHPLGQAEWIRLLGLLFDRQALADSLFFATVYSYNALKTTTAELDTCPTVFTEKKYGDFWYMPGGESYFARLLQDAGARYVFGDNSDTGSVPYAFETILDRAGKADFWLFKYYLPGEITYSQLAAEHAGYTLFDAFKNRNVYACNTSKTPDYYQELPLHPDWILKDLIAIFHPDRIPDYRPRYYLRLPDVSERHR
jgi:iron complex transport system substrate-binding protein